jgi:preprotein translocase subunit SecD
MEKEVVATSSEPVTKEAPVVNPEPQQPQAEEAKPASPEQKAEVEVKEKVFTQAQLDEIVINRLGKERARFLKKLGVDDESKLDDIVKRSQEYDSVRSENESLKLQKAKQDKVNILTKSNADPEFTDYLIEKIEVAEGEKYEDAVNKYLEEHPKFRNEEFKNVNSSIKMSGESYPDFTKMTTAQYLSWREKNKL